MILAFDVKKELIDDMFAKKVFYLGYENNIFVRPINNTIYFMPPYIISENQINFYSEKLELILNKLLNK
jgi:adenosylmethionine-8-amino-7-oxononanoate aminotransferase